MDVQQAFSRGPEPPNGALDSVPLFSLAARRMTGRRWLARGEPMYRDELAAQGGPSAEDGRNEKLQQAALDDLHEQDAPGLNGLRWKTW